MANRKILYKLLPFLQGGYVADASSVQVDDSALANVTADDAQELASELNRLFTEVAQIDTPQQARPLTTFAGAITITSANFADYQNRNAVYVATADARPTFLLPTESNIPSGQYPVTFEISHFGGTARFETGSAPTNTIVIDTQSTDVLQRPDGTVINFAELHRGDVGVITKASAGQPWIVRETNTDPRTSLLPNGAFNLRPEQVTTDSGSLTGFGLTSIVAGYAYETSVDIPGLGLTGTDAGDVLVATKDNPSLIISTTNEDWIVIRDVKNFPLTMAEIRFLAQFTESNRFVPGSSALTNTRIWVLDSVPDTAPLLTDAQNDRYNATENLNDKVLLVAVPVSAGSRTDDFLLKITSDNGEDQLLSFTGNMVERTDLGVISQRRYYMLGTNNTTAASFGIPNLHNIEIFQATQQRLYTATDALNLIASLKDIPDTALEGNVQAHLYHGVPFNAATSAILNGFETTFTQQSLDENSILIVSYGELSKDFSGAAFTANNRLFPSVYAQEVQVFLPQGTNVTAVRKVSDNNALAAFERIGDLDLGLGSVVTHYRVMLPAITVGQTQSTQAYQIEGTYQTFTLTGAYPAFKIDPGNLSPDVQALINHATGSVPPSLQGLANHLTETNAVTTTWGEVKPSPIRATLEREAAAFWDENRTSFTGNYFADKTGLTVGGFARGNVFYYSDPNDANNRNFPGAQSYAYRDSIRLHNTTGNTPIANNYQKVLAFDYALDEALEASDDLAMVRFGDTTNEPLIGLSRASGLHVKVGRSDGGAQSRTYLNEYQVDNNQWHAQVGQTLNDEAEIIIPDSATGALTVTVAIHVWNNDNDVTVDTQTVTIANVSADQSGQIVNYTWTINGTEYTLPVTFTYDAVNNDTSTTRRVLDMSATLHNAAFRYDISAGESVTETWNASQTYADQPINAGSGQDQFGFFDPTQYTTEHVRERNRVILALVPWRDGDTASDPEVALRVVVDGETEGDASNSYKIRLNRAASDFDFTDLRLGNVKTNIAHVQLYSYDTADNAPREAELQTLYNSFDNWLGTAIAPGQAVESFTLDANLELSTGHSFILTDTQTSTRKRVTIVNNVVTVTDA